MRGSGEAVRGHVDAECGFGADEDGVRMLHLELREDAEPFQEPEVQVVRLGFREFDPVV
jgi:hypothetical protein